MLAIGIMSGSSLDGLDLAIVDFDIDDSVQLKDWKLLKSKTVELPEELKQSLSQLIESTAITIAYTNASFSKFIADSILDFKAEIDIESPIIVGVHGHTVAHFPEEGISWQLLNGGYICAKIGLPVVCDFRNQDIAYGGQGTPMAVLADRDLFRGYDYYINLGGIANVSYLTHGNWMAYDLFPCNQVLNHYAAMLGHVYDRDGEISALGNVNQALLNQMLSDSYITQAAPKSIDNTWVRNHWIKMMDDYNLSPADCLRTQVEFMTIDIVNTISRAGSKVLITGGGAHNKYFVNLLKTKLPTAEFSISDRQLIDYKEAILIAYAAVLRWQSQPNFIANATGASRNSIGGAVYLPATQNLTQ